MCTVLMSRMRSHRRAARAPRPVLMSHQLTEVRCSLLLLWKEVSPPLSALFLLYVVVMPQKAAYTFHQFLFGIDSMEELRSRQRIARKKRS